MSKKSFNIAGRVKSLPRKNFWREVLEKNGIYLPSGEFRQVEKAPQAIPIPKEATTRGRLIQMRKAAQPHAFAKEMLVVFNDLQLKRQCDEAAFGAFINFVDDQKERITHIVANGDITDYYLQSRFAHDPNHFDDAHEEVMATRWVFEVLAKLLPNAQKVFIDGNHDKRFEEILRSAGNGYPVNDWIKTPDEQFKLKELGWKHLPYGRGNYYRWHERIFYHGARAAGKGNNAKGEQDDAKYSTTTAHTNRNEYWQQRTVLGEVLTSYTHGGFSKDNLEFVKKANSGWNQGFGVYYWHPRVGEQVFPVELKHGNPRFVFEGKLYEAPKGWEIPTSGRARDIFNFR